MKQRQQGMGMVGLLVVVVVLGVLGISVVRIAPLYVDNWSLVNIIELVVDEKTGSQTSPAQVRTALSKQFTTNRIQAVKLSDIQIKSDGRTIHIDLSYERRVPLLYNIDAVVKFEDIHYEIARP